MVMNTHAWHRLASLGAGVAGGCPHPSALLAALREAEAAHVCCKRLLPTLWTGILEVLQRKAACMEEPLQLMVELQGDSLLSPPGPARAATEQRVKAALERSAAARQEADRTHPSELQQGTCSGCKNLVPTLRKCAARKQAQYCRCAPVLVCASSP